MNQIILWIAFLISLNLFAGREKKLSKTDLAIIYDEDPFHHVDALAYHNSDTSTTIYLQLLNKELTELQNDTSLNYEIKYFFYKNWNDKLPADSGKRSLSGSMVLTSQKGVTLNFTVPLTFGEKGVFQFKIRNPLDTDETFQAFIETDKTNRNSRQNFLITNKNGYPLFLPAVKPQDAFKVTFNQKNIKQLNIRYYKQEFPLAKPPFAIEKKKPYQFEPDSIYTISMKGGESNLLQFLHAGFYHIQVDLQESEGITIFQFNNSFPRVESPASAIAPLRYLTTEKEFVELLAFENQKLAVDQFWLDRASQIPDRARRMIQRYYQRVEASNLMFTSYHEGWKTDRGLIYIIYGPPSEVYRDGDDEEWVYGEQSNPLSIKFFFSKVENPFTSNDFHLNRSIVYKSSWYVAIENWRRD